MVNFIIVNVLSIYQLPISLLRFLKRKKVLNRRTTQ